MKRLVQINAGIEQLNKANAEILEKEQEIKTVKKNIFRNSSKIIRCRKNR